MSGDAAAASGGCLALRSRPRVYNIPAGTPFLDGLAKGIWADVGGDRLALARVTVLLPTRRACRNLRDAFLRITEGKPLLLPRLQPIGDVDDDEFLMSGGDDAAAFDLPPALAPLERLLLLTRLVAARPDSGGNPAVALRLAESLAELLDSAQIEEASLDRLEELVPDDLAGHWQVTLDFLRIVRDNWPKILAERGQLDPVTRRIQLIRTMARRWQERPPADPVYAAGSTGSIPATAELLGVVARLPSGALILPGLDLALDEQSWTAIGEDAAHPQYGIHRLLETLGVKRGEVRDWHGIAGDEPLRARAEMIGQALRPASTTDAWLELAPPPDSAFTGLQRIECAGPQEEAGAIALLMREMLESEGKTAALVTPDRNLARRVAAELARWNIEIDDSAGMPLERTAPGVFFRLVGRVIAEALAPASFLALLKHPLASGGMDRAVFLRNARRLERRVLRGLRPAPGFEGLRRAIAALGDGDLAEWIDGIAKAAAPLEQLIEAQEVPVADLVTVHTQVAEWLATCKDGTSIELWRGPAGEALAGLIGELRLAAPLLDRVPGRAWPDLLDALMAPRVVRPLYSRHPRLYIWGLLEARLQQADLLILGGLNEGSWPPEVQEDPWLSRPMRTKLGLSPPERRIGLSAHDFSQYAAAPRVVLTRATKVDGTPTLPSRWLLRLEAMLTRDPRWEKTRVSDCLDWLRRLDQPAAFASVPAPKPRPPLAARPRELSVTQVETWIRDPYAIYARYILGLKPLEPIDADPSALDRGRMIHTALDMFMRAHRDGLPPDALARLIACGQQAFSLYLDRPSIRAFWWPRFVRIATWFVNEFERPRRARGVKTLATEIAGAVTLSGPGRPFVLRGKADRIDALPDGALVIIDYKTGQPPSHKQVAAGLSPQLPLEAMIALEHGFDGIAVNGVAELAYIRLSGGAIAGEFKPVDARRDGAAVPPEMLAAEARAGLLRRIADFDRPDTAYLSRPRPQWLTYEGDYDHLARVKEWSAISRGEA